MSTNDATMATVRRWPPSRATTRRADHHRFFTTMSIVIAVTVFVGFAPSYYLRSAFSTSLPRGDLSLLVHLHGLAFTAWTLLFVAQTVLAGRGHVHVHRRLGIAGLLVALTAMAVALTLNFVSRADAWKAWFAVHPSLIATVADLMTDNSGSIINFGVLVAAALCFRHRRDTHGRLMVFASCAILNAPMARILDKFQPWITPAMIGTLFSYGAANFMILPFYVAVVVFDGTTLRRLHPATVWAGGLLFLLQPICMVVVRHSGAGRALLGGG